MSPVAPHDSLREILPRVDELFGKQMQAVRAPAAVWGVVYDGALIHAQAAGTGDLDSGAPARADTVFRIASMTKSFTAAAIMQLREAGRLQLDDPAVAYVPEMAAWRPPTGDGPPISIRHLLTMQAGLPQDDPWADRQLHRDDLFLSTVYRAGASFSSPPGSRFEYSNLGYMLLGRIISNVSGMPALDYMTDHLLRPLGMADTVWSAADVPTGRLARPYVWLDERHIDEELIPSGGDNAAFAGLFTTVADLGRWVAFFLDAWPARDEADSPILSRASRRAMQQAWSQLPPATAPVPLGAPPRPVAAGYGFGLSCYHNGRYGVIGHGGGLPGYGSYMCWSPDHQLGIVAMGNVRYAHLSRVSFDALRLLVDEAAPPAYRLPAAPALVAAVADVNRLVAGWDDALADGIFADNFFLDLDRDHWRARLEKLREVHGELQPAGGLKPENHLRGSWRLDGERGHVNLWLSLTPTVPTRIQALRVRSVPPPTAAMSAMIAAVAELVGRPTKGALDRLRARGSDREQLWRGVQLAHLLTGGGAPGDPIAGDGEKRAVVSWESASWKGSAVVTIDEQGQLRDLVFRTHME